MAGGIYTREVCTICGDRLKDNGRNAVSCPAHPGITARRMVVQFGRKHSVRFTVYAQAQKHLNFLRHEKDEREDLFDIKDYSAKRPKSFAVLAPRYLAEKRDLGRKSIRKIERTINLASELWGYTNLRDITVVIISLEFRRVGKWEGDLHWKREPAVFNDSSKEQPDRDRRRKTDGGKNPPCPVL